MWWPSPIMHCYLFMDICLTLCHLRLLFQTCVLKFSSLGRKECPFYHFLQCQCSSTHWCSVVSNWCPFLDLEAREAIVHKLRNIPFYISHCPVPAPHFLSASQLPKEIDLSSSPDRHIRSSPNLSSEFHTNKWICFFPFFIHLPCFLK